MATFSQKEKTERLLDEVSDVAAQAYGEDALACAEEMMWEDPAIIAFIRKGANESENPFNFQHTHIVRTTFAAMAAEQSSPQRNEEAEELRRVAETNCQQQNGFAGSRLERTLKAIGRYTEMLRPQKQHLQ